MAQGVKTSADKVAKFRAEYLTCGNASEAARRVGLEIYTGCNLANKLNQDESFQNERKSLRARYLEECIAMRMDVTREAQRLAYAEPVVPDGNGKGPVIVNDARPQYMRAVIDAEKNAHHLAKLEDGPEERGGPVNVIVCPTPEAAERAAEVVRGEKPDEDAE